ncbi:MAG: ABC-F family ATP-binding cassette domain-containing protein [Actinobacteria bacterium]|nr:ABC-F family ATP-binding cassette domain-containing protein [Actinomycetota bacterium]
MQLHLTDARYTYPGASQPILDNINTILPSGWTGIIGPNGCGKTTLAKIICKLLPLDGGTLSPSLFSIYCRQETDRVPEGLDDFTMDYSPHAIHLHTQLGVEDDWPWRFETLSHGERKRLQIAVALSRNPDVLAIDEPTNHLDTEARQIITSILADYHGIGLLISHDRQLLDALAHRCLFMEGNTAIMRPGTYSQAFRQAEQERATTLHDRANTQHDLKRIAVEKVRREEEAGRTAARRSGRNLAKHDSDGRERLRLAVISGQDGKAGRISAQMDARVAAAHDKLSSLHVEKRYTADVWMETQPSSRRILLRMNAAAIPLGGARYLHIPDLALGATDHVGICGPNGTGKSTLVKAMMERLDPDIRTLFIPQELDTCSIDGLLLRMHALSAENLGRTMSILAQMGSRPNHLLEGNASSPGELMKFMLADGMLNHPQIIVMDEPTNHLDITSIEALQRILTNCPCALVLVSHDEALLQATTQICWKLAETTTGETKLEVS